MKNILQQLKHGNDNVKTTPTTANIVGIKYSGSESLRQW